MYFKREYILTLIGEKANLMQDLQISEINFLSDRFFKSTERAFAPLEYYVALCGSYLPTFRENLYTLFRNAGEKLPIYAT